MNRKSLHFIVAGIVGLAMAASSASASGLLDDRFNYSNGNLVGNGGWANHSGTGNFIQVSNGTITLDQGAGSREDASKTFSAAQSNSATTYAGFDLNVPSITTFGAGDYFAHFKISGNTVDFRSRVAIVAPGAGGNYRVGVASTSFGSSPIVNWTSDLSFGTTYRVVHKYNAATGEARLWVNPTAEGDASIVSTFLGTPAAVDQYALRQGSVLLGTQVLDNLRAGTAFGDALYGTPAPAASPAGMVAVASLLLGAGAMFVVRRRATVA
jgi:hypothetical protein